MLVLVLACLSEEEETMLKRVKLSLNRKSGQSGVIFVKMPQLEEINFCPAEIAGSLD